MCADTLGPRVAVSLACMVAAARQDGDTLMGRNRMATAAVQSGAAEGKAAAERAMTSLIEGLGPLADLAEEEGAERRKTAAAVVGAFDSLISMDGSSLEAEAAAAAAMAAAAATAAGTLDAREMESIQGEGTGARAEGTQASALVAAQGEEKKSDVAGDSEGEAEGEGGSGAAVAEVPQRSAEEEARLAAAVVGLRVGWRWREHIRKGLPFLVQGWWPLHFVAAWAVRKTPFTFSNLRPSCALEPLLLAVCLA